MSETTREVQRFSLTVTDESVSVAFDPDGDLVAYDDYQRIVAERDAAVRLIDDAAAHWLALNIGHPIQWEGAIDAAMAAACNEIRSLKARLAAYEKITDEMVTAASQFYSYGATRGNHSDNGHGPLPGPLTGHINAMGSLVRLLMDYRAAVAAETQGEG